MSDTSRSGSAREIERHAILLERLAHEILAAVQVGRDDLATLRGDAREVMGCVDELRRTERLVLNLPELRDDMPAETLTDYLLMTAQQLRHLLDNWSVDLDADASGSLLQELMDFEPDAAADVLEAMAFYVETGALNRTHRRWNRRSAELALRDARAWVEGRPVADMPAIELESDRELTRMLRAAARELRRLGRG